MELVGGVLRPNFYVVHWSYSVIYKNYYFETSKNNNNVVIDFSKSINH